MMKKILIIEDEVSIHSNLRYLLENNNFVVHTAENGYDGVKIAKTVIPDLIISDIMMPGLNGYEVKEVLSSNKATASIPFIFLTALAEMDDLRKGMNLGADDYLVKPFKSEEILSAINSRLKRYEQLLEGKEVSDEQNAKNNLMNNNKIVVNINGNLKLILIDNIKYLSAEAEYSYIHLKDGPRQLVRKLLKEWEDLLPKNKFIRIHRSTMVNIDFISKIKKNNHRSYIVVLSGDNEELAVSQRYSVKLRKIMSV